MGQPHPPQGNQTQQTEKPLKVYSEPYLEGGALPIGAVVNPEPMPGFPLFSDGVPRVPLATGWAIVNVGDYVISSRFSGQPLEVISAEEHLERFGPSDDAELGA